MSKKIDLGTVLAWKWPGAVFETHGEEILRWTHNFPQPSEIEIAAAREEYISFKAKNLYKDKRKPEYPSLEDLADAIYHEKLGNLEPMEQYINRVKLVKDKYPKP